MGQPASKSIDMAAPELVDQGVPFIVSVDVRGATPGRPVTVRIDYKHSRGALQPLGTGVFDATTGGIVFASFKVLLPARGLALLVASAHDAASTRFEPDGVIVEVV